MGCMRILHGRCCLWTTQRVIWIKSSEGLEQQRLGLGLGESSGWDSTAEGQLDPGVLRPGFLILRGPGVGVFPSATFLEEACLRNEKCGGFTCGYVI